MMKKETYFKLSMFFGATLTIVSVFTIGYLFSNYGIIALIPNLFLLYFALTGIRVISEVKGVE